MSAFSFLLPACITLFPGPLLPWIYFLWSHNPHFQSINRVVEWLAILRNAVDRIVDEYVIAVDRQVRRIGGCCRTLALVVVNEILKLRAIDNEATLQRQIDFVLAQGNKAVQVWAHYTHRAVHAIKIRHRGQNVWAALSERGYQSLRYGREENRIAPDGTKFSFAQDPKFPGD